MNIGHNIERSVKKIQEIQGGEGMCEAVNKIITNKVYNELPAEPLTYKSAVRILQAKTNLGVGEIEESLSQLVNNNRVIELRMDNQVIVRKKTLDGIKGI